MTRDMSTDSPPAAEQVKNGVREFWDVRPCGAKHAQAAEGTPEFFAAVERTRYQLEPFIEDYARFRDAKDERVLEIGVGLGTDLARFAGAGAEVTGVDLSPKSVRLARRRLTLAELDGEVLQADAEQLPFPDASFDRVYSWGVLHHTPDTQAAVKEAIRVLRPGGELCVMLYGRRSWVAFGLWARHGLLLGRPRRSLADLLASHMESPGTKGFSRREIATMFRGLEDLRAERVSTPYDRRVVGPLATLTGRFLGWFIVIRGRAPQPPRPSG
jgi:SAM-dependent methyltransferase